MTATPDARQACALELAGNGVMLVRERAIARTVQTALERLYRIDGAPPVDGFVTPAEENEREAVLLRESDGALEIAVRLPTLKETSDEPRSFDLDSMCQIIEGVSHFVMISERAQRERETTHLELELQAEVDKYVVLAAAVASRSGTLDVGESERLRARLYESVSYEHAEASEKGSRYRLANRAASRFVRKLEREYAATKRIDAMRSHLRRFFAGNQEEKLRLSAA